MRFECKLENETTIFHALCSLKRNHYSHVPQEPIYNSVFYFKNPCLLALSSTIFINFCFNLSAYHMKYQIIQRNKPENIFAQSIDTYMILEFWLHLHGRNASILKRWSRGQRRRPRGGTTRLTAFGSSSSPRHHESLDVAARCWLARWGWLTGGGLLLIGRAVDVDFYVEHHVFFNWRETSMGKDYKEYIGLHILFLDKTGYL